MDAALEPSPGSKGTRIQPQSKGPSSWQGAEEDGGSGGYSRCYPWDRGHRWDPGVRRDRGHRGSRERQRCRGRPRRGRRGGEGAAGRSLSQAVRQGWDTHGCTLGTRLTISTGVALPERKRKRRVTLGPGGREAKGQGTVEGHLQQDQQRQRGRGDRAHHGHPEDLRCHEHLGDRFHPGEEEERGRAVSVGAAMKTQKRTIFFSILGLVSHESNTPQPGEASEMGQRATSVPMMGRAATSALDTLALATLAMATLTWATLALATLALATLALTTLAPSTLALAASGHRSGHVKPA